MFARPVSLTALYARFDFLAEGHAPAEDSGAAHRAVLARLDDNRARAEAAGWTSLAITRRGGMGRLYLEGTLPSGAGREEIADWSAPNDTAQPPRPVRSRA